MDGAKRRRVPAKEPVMKYLMLLYSNPAAWETLSPEDLAASMAFFAELQQETTASGELVTAAGLADVSQARTVRTQAGEPVATDGPFAEAKEVLASYAIYDVDSPDRAMELAGRVAAATSGAVEVWPIMDFNVDAM
jgi:hypothetical protein